MGNENLFGGGTRRRMMLMTRMEEDDMTKEWKLLDTVDFAETESKEYDVDGITEIFVQGNLLKCESDTASGMLMKINNVNVGLQLDTAKSSANGTYQHGYAKYNGLFWDVRISTGSNSRANLFGDANAKHPYNVVLDVGEASKLNVARSSNAYPIASGTLEIYAR